MTSILAAQGLEHPDHDAVYRTLLQSFIKAGPWSEHLNDAGRPDWQYMATGPVPEWKSTYTTWLRQWELTFAAHDLDGDPEHAANVTRTGLAAAPTYDDAHATIEQLAASGYTVSLLSNADEDFLRGALSRCSFEFSAIQTSESLRIYKPNRALFLAHCEELGVDPASVLYVGDSLPTDVRGASAAGMRTAWVRRSERAPADDLPTPDIEIAELSDLCAILDSTNLHGTERAS